MQKKYLLHLFFQIVVMAACNSSGVSTEDRIENNNNVIELELAQVKEAGIKIATPTADTFYETFPVTGILVSPPGSKAYLQSPVSGWVDAILAFPGDWVSSGTPILKIKSIEAIEWQRDYAEVKAELKQARSDYQRIKSLSESEIAAKKELLQAETRLQSLSARLSAARAKLVLLGEDTLTHTPNPTFLLRAPISGVLSNLNVNLNSNITPGTEMGFIINTKNTQIAIHLLPKDLGKIYKGQQIEFSVPGTDKKTVRAVIQSISPSLDKESGGVIAMARLTTHSILYNIENLTVAAQLLHTPTIRLAIPESAIVESDNISYVYEVISKDNDHLKIKPRKIQVAGKFGNKVAILDTLGSIVIEGTGQLPLP